MTLLSLSHNQRWGFCSVDDSTKLEELTAHSYDTRLKEKWDARSMKDVVLIDLQENNLHSLNAYIKAINAVVNVPSMQQYIQKEYIIPVVADWPGQIYLKTAISHFILYPIKMPEAQLCHFPLGFNTLHRPDPFQYCDASNCSISFNTDPIQVLVCDGIDEHVQSLLERLHRFEEEQQAEVEDLKNNIPCDDDDENELIKYVACALEEALLIPGWRRKSEREGTLSSLAVPVIHVSIVDFLYSLVDESSQDDVERASMP
ncbi:9441_t:CDS:2 [Funneliformis caledonium]|uniref:9441_t:CDS:1 n=1 Tax=Funneliformis caledonium TaxID=1117310 RepID=A0A9N8WPG4_9GLOM|nr:9441_t:CDS:2 [Funneliformis caledonium]